MGPLQGLVKPPVQPVVLIWNLIPKTFKMLFP